MLDTLKHFFSRPGKQALPSSAPPAPETESAQMQRLRDALKKSEPSHTLEALQELDRFAGQHRLPPKPGKSGERAR